MHYTRWKRYGSATIVKAERNGTGRRTTSLYYKKEYQNWYAIKERCYRMAHKDYKNYGGRGIKLHEPWRKSFTQFHLDIFNELGQKPTGDYSLDRIDNNGNYEPGNVRWATRNQQNNNKRPHYKPATYTRPDLRNRPRDNAGRFI